MGIKSITAVHRLLFRRKFNEALNENPGEHFTPRDVVHLMVDLMLAGDDLTVFLYQRMRDYMGVKLSDEHIIPFSLGGAPFSGSCCT